MTKIRDKVHSVDGLDNPIPGIGIIPYLIEERQSDLTLIDTCFRSDLPRLEKYIEEVGYNLGNIKRIILTHVHPDHIEAANDLKKRTNAKIFSYWIEAPYLAQNPAYHGPPTHESFLKVLQHFNIKIEDVVKRFGPLQREPILVDGLLNDGDTIGSLQVIHTPGHTPGHISLYHREFQIVFGADFLFNSVLGNEGLFIPHSEVSIDPVTAAISVQRVSRIKFDKLLLSHQSGPIEEGAQKAVEKVAEDAIKKTKQS